MLDKVSTTDPSSIQMTLQWDIFIVAFSPSPENSHELCEECNVYQKKIELYDNVTIMFAVVICCFILTPWTPFGGGGGGMGRNKIRRKVGLDRAWRVMLNTGDGGGWGRIGNALGWNPSTGSEERGGERECRST